MQIVMFLVPLMLILVTVGIVLFSWAVKNGQYDDLEGPAHRILYDDDKDKIPPEARTDAKAGNTEEQSTDEDVRKDAPDRDDHRTG
ncbi:cytochrome oxidase maturation protein, cbb3-type [Marinobacter gudaonensis]|uniref:Cytochrome oxidase maturation protein, cbb3-type n=1 Tax=Marinobacter gudaonensis TaxID=375760 RepID=A0A1I6GF88_9GAMM|nr:cytochrome oxidase maturation protein, cbb3-type [Marinobacter gudaonensis]